MNFFTKGNTLKIYIKYFVSVTLCCLIILVEGCSSSILVDVWNNPSYRGPSLKKLLIVAIRQNAIQRRLWEDVFVNELSKYGISATSSYNLFPNELPDTNEVIQSIQEKGFDGIIVSHLLDSETKSHYVESYVSTEIVSRYNIFRKKYDTYYRYTKHPGYMESENVSRRAVEVWETRDEGQIIWGATSNSTERNSEETIKHEIATLVIKDLARLAIIKSER